MFICNTLLVPFPVVSSYVGHHNSIQCYNQYKFHMTNKQGRWSAEEDEVLCIYTVTVLGYFEHTFI